MRGTVLELFPYADLANHVGPGWNIPRSKFSGITIAHNVRTKPEVDDVMRDAAAAGATIEKSPEDTSWGGYSGYFSDPDGYLWKVAWGAFELDDEGSLIVT